MAITIDGGLTTFQAIADRAECHPVQVWHAVRALKISKVRVGRSWILAIDDTPKILEWINNSRAKKAAMRDISKDGGLLDD